MRKYKKHVEETYQAIREENKDFLTGELRETIEQNRNDKGRSKANVWLITLFCILIMLCMGSFLLFRAGKFASNLITESTTLAVLNENLKKTYMNGELDSVYMTKKKGRQPIYFTVYYTSETESLYMESTFVVIIDKTYKTDTDTQYTEHTEFLGFSLDYKKTKSTETGADRDKLYNTKIDAYLDTGEERYLITYEELSINESENFQEYLEKTIKKL